MPSHKFLCIAITSIEQFYPQKKGYLGMQEAIEQKRWNIEQKKKQRANTWYQLIFICCGVIKKKSLWLIIRLKFSQDT